MACACVINLLMGPRLVFAEPAAPPTEVVVRVAGGNSAEWLNLESMCRRVRARCSVTVHETSKPSSVRAEFECACMSQRGADEFECLNNSS